MGTPTQAGMAIEMVEVFDADAELLELSEAHALLTAEEAMLDAELLAIHKTRQGRIAGLKARVAVARQRLTAHVRARGDDLDLGYGKVRLKTLPPHVHIEDEQHAIKVLREASFEHRVVIWTARLDKSELHKLSPETLAEAGITIGRRQVCEIQLLSGTRLSEDLP